VNPLQWFSRLFSALRNGPQSISQNSSLPSKASLKSEPTKPSEPPKSGPSTKAKSPNSYAETRTKTPNVSAKPIVPQSIVLHHSGGSYAGGVSWIKDPASRVSYHCLVAPDGRRTVFAPPTARTWHAGISTWQGKRDLNSWAVGASFAGDTYKEPLTDDAMASMVEYLLPILKEYGLSLNNVTDHRTVSPGRKDDLKPSELARFKAYLAARQRV
jgi:N-acetyl-anhydromuramyl-L-alanine amidase AmpD